MLFFLSLFQFSLQLFFFLFDFGQISFPFSPVNQAFSVKLFSSVDVLVLVFNAFDVSFFNLFHTKVGKFFAEGLSLEFLSGEDPRDFEDFPFAVKELKFKRDFWENVTFFIRFMLETIDALLEGISNGIFILMLDFLFRKIQNNLIFKIVFHAENRKSAEINLILFDFSKVGLFLG